jgi:predicted nucleotide-binding protein (sugar kinase/HSP70/actin superfamily)
MGLGVNRTEPRTTRNIIKHIGIPRAISYYNNYPFYYGFFNSLGIEIVLSDKTTTKLINDGANLVVSDTCFPIKVFVGHVVNLLDKGCEAIFVPSIQSTGYKINNCSKVRALPEIIRNIIDKPFKMIEPTLDKTEGLGLKDFCYETANQLGITDSEQIENAIHKGWKVYDDFINMTQAGVSYSEAIKNAIEGKTTLKKMELVKPLSVVIMAHGYNLYDERVSMRLLQKLDKMGVKAFTALNISKEESLNAIHELDEIQYWANELDLTGTAAYYILNDKVDGIIALSAFGCGPDSLMVDEIQYHANEHKMPMLHLTIDEHTGEAGFVTRLEAFVDMLMRKKRKTEQKIKKNNSEKENSVSNVTEIKQERVLTKI